MTFFHISPHSPFLSHKSAYSLSPRKPYFTPTIPADFRQMFPISYPIFQKRKEFSPLPGKCRLLFAPRFRSFLCEDMSTVRRHTFPQAK